jgi:hypothetical protein
MVIARVLVVLAVLLAVVSLLAAFVRYQALDTDSVSDTASALIADDEVREQLAASLVEQLYANVDVAEVLEERLPPDQQGLAGVLAGGLRELTDRAAVRMLEQPRVQAFWIASFSRAHAQLLEVLENEGEVFQVSEGAIVLNLQPLMVQLGDRVAILGQVSRRFGPDAGVIEVMDAGELETAQDLTRLLKALGTWLWVLPVLLAAIALWIVPGRRQSILRMIAVGSILGGLLVLVVRRMMGNYVVEELVQSETVQPAVRDAWEIITAPLRDGGFTFLGLGVLVLLAAWLAGTSSSAVGARRGLAPYLARADVAYGIAAALFLGLLWWQPTVQTSRWQLMLAAAIVLALGVELLRRQTAREVPEPGPIDLAGTWRRRLGRRGPDSSA